MKAIVIEVEKSTQRKLSVVDAAAYLSISRSAIRYLVDGGHLKRVRLPRINRACERLDRYLLDKADLGNIVERSKDLLEKIS